MPKVVSIHSYRGGTGKSNFTANLATTIALQANRVGVVDTDVPSPGIHNLFCLEPEQMGKTLNNYLWGESPIGEAAYDVSANVGVSGSGKLFLVPSSVKADDIAKILTFSPPLDAKGNSTRGSKICEDLSKDFGLHLFNVAKSNRNLDEWIAGGEGINDW